MACTEHGTLLSHTFLGACDTGLSDPDEFVSAAEYNPRRRRLQLAGTEENAPGSLYRELSSWCNPEQLEKSLQVRNAWHLADLLW